MGTELKPFGGDFQPVKSWREEKRELAVAEASEPAGRNRLFLPKDDSLSGKTFSSSRPAKHSWQHIVAHVSLVDLGLGPDRSVFFKSFNWQEAKTCPPCYVLFTKVTFWYLILDTFRESMAFLLRLSSLGRKVLFDPSSRYWDDVRHGFAVWRTG